MTAANRLKGQEVEIRIVSGSALVNTIDSIGSFNDNVALEILEDGFIGEPVNRFDEVLNGYRGDFEVQPNTASWYDLVQSIERRAMRQELGLVFNIIRTDFFTNGSTAVVTFVDVKWGAVPQSLGGRKEFAKSKFEFACSERLIQINNLI